jgi:hypothetical protein
MHCSHNLSPSARCTGRRRIAPRLIGIRGSAGVEEFFRDRPGPVVELKGYQAMLVKL